MIKYKLKDLKFVNRNQVVLKYTKPVSKAGILMPDVSFDKAIKDLDVTLEVVKVGEGCETLSKGDRVVLTRRIMDNYTALENIYDSNSDNVDNENLMLINEMVVEVYIKEKNYERQLKEEEAKEIVKQRKNK